VSFFWGECASAGGTVPDELVSSISPSRVAMLGTNCKSVRCTALEGDVGTGTRCSIYEQRSSTCREFEASWTDGQHNPECDAARAAFGLAAIVPPSHYAEAWPAFSDAVCVA
jgi:Fe-S-cluster containining protein